LSTIIVHGTVPVRAPHNVKWWWNSWHPDGFLHDMARGMKLRSQSDWHDVWHVGGVHVSELAALSPGGFDWRDPTRAFRPGNEPPFLSHHGCFMWSGSNMHSERKRAGRALANYLNVVHSLAPEEPIRIVAHSHGCNALKVATCSEALDARIVFESVFLLACPHVVVKGPRGAGAPYGFDTRRCRPGQLFNLYVPEDSVQRKWAQLYPGPPEHIGSLLGTEEMFATDQSTAHGSFRNYEIPTEDRGAKAHSAIHGSRVGGLIGLYLGSDGSDFDQLYREFSTDVFPVPEGDCGE
jgi:hypothetical protein